MGVKFDPLLGALRTTDSSSSGGMSIGSTVTSGTAKSVLFIDGSGNLAQDNANLYYDSATKILTLGTLGAALGSVLSVGTTSASATATMAQFTMQGSLATNANPQVLNFLLNDTSTNNVGTLIGINGISQKSGASGNVTSLSAVTGNVRLTAGATATNMIGVSGAARVTNASNATAVTLFSALAPLTTSAGLIGTIYGYRAAALKITGVTTAYGFAQDGTTDLNYFLGKAGFGLTGPTAYIHTAAGTAAANTAPIKLTAGTNLGTPEDGVFEYDGTHLYFTIGATRNTLI
jgi:hypothetical protein